MRKIKTVAIDKYNLILQIVCGTLIILAYAFSKSLMWIAGAISMIYIISDTKWEQKISFFVFMLLFSPIFKISLANTSLFMFVKLSMVLCFTFKNNEKFSFSFIAVLIGFFAYTMTLSEIFQTDYLVSLINIVLWVLVAYIIVNTLDIEKTTPVARSFSNAIIITGIIGLFIEKIPFLSNELHLLTTYAEDGALISRYAGFFKDPNFFTVLSISSLWFIYYEFGLKKINITEFLTRSMLVSFVSLLTMSKSCVVILLVFWFYVLFTKNEIQASPKVIIFFTLIVGGIFFVVRNPYWISDVLFRFTGGSTEIDTNILTTGRSDIWGSFTKKMLDDFSWIFGNGLSAKFSDRAAAAHNTVIQLFYNVGLFGSILYMLMFTHIYKSSVFNKGKTHNKVHLSYKMSLISLIVLLMFLDGLFIEMFYYTTPLCFVYISGNANKNLQDYDKNEFV